MADFSKTSDSLCKAAKTGNVECIEILLKAGADVNEADNQNYTPLDHAIWKGHDKCVELLLKEGANVNIKGPFCPLSYSASGGHSRCVNLLLKAGANVNGSLSDSSGAASPLMKAARNDHLGCLELLLKAGADVNIIDSGGISALVHAAHGGHVECMRKLIEAGADVNNASSGISGLHVAAERGNDQSVRLLIEAGADVNTINNMGKTALIMAINRGSVECVNALLEAGADVKGNDGITALTFATQSNKAEFVELLLLKTEVDIDDALMIAARSGCSNSLRAIVEAGADVYIRDVDGATPLMHAVAKDFNTGANILINAGTDVNDKSEITGLTALMIAADFGHLTSLNVLLGVGFTKTGGRTAQGEQCKRTVNMNDLSNEGRTALMYAAQAGQSDCVNALIKAGADVNIMANETTALILAVSRRRDRCVELLMKAGASLAGVDVNAPGSNGVTLLMQAASSGNVEGIAAVLEAGADVNIKDDEGNTALIWASIEGYAECAKLLLEAGANVNVVNKGGATALLMAVSRRNHECVLVLVESGVDVNWKNDDKEYRKYFRVAYLSPSYKLAMKRSQSIGQTALMIAAREGDCTIAKVFIEAGADVNITDREGRTALMIAAEAGYYSTVEVLIQAGADVNKKNACGSTALIGASKQRLYKAENKSINVYKCTKLILAAGADVNHANGEGRTALIEACSTGENTSRCVNLLIEAGADVNINQSVLEEVTALEAAATHGNSANVELLIAAGADVNFHPNSGRTAVLCAAANGHTECVEILVRAGADVNKADNDDVTLLMKAVEVVSYKCVNILIGAGADVNLCAKAPAKPAAESGDNVLARFAQNELFRSKVPSSNLVNNTTALMIAALHTDYKCLEALIKAGANVNAVNSSGLTALICLFKDERRQVGSKYKCAKLLLGAGADVNATDNTGNTALIETAGKADLFECFKLLLNAGADVNIVATTEDGPTTALIETVCCELNNQGQPIQGGKQMAVDSVRLLLKSGAHVNKKCKGYANVLQFYIAESNSADRDIAMLLFAAGDTITETTVEVKGNNMRQRRPANRRNSQNLLPPQNLVPPRYRNLNFHRVHANQMNFQNLPNPPNVVVNFSNVVFVMAQGPAPARRVNVPDFLFPAESLANRCRDVIRQRLLERSRVNLFLQVRQLSVVLPSYLQSYLLYHMALEPKF